MTTVPRSNYKKLRVREFENGLISIEEPLLWFFWWPVVRTYNIRGATAFMQMTGLEYNKDTGYYE